MQPQFQSSPNSSQLAVIQRKLYLDGRIRSGVNWFFWIAGFSLINTIVYLFGGQLTFVVGLGITQIIDGVMSVIAKDFGANGMIVRVIGFAIDIAIAGVFVAFREIAPGTLFPQATHSSNDALHYVLPPRRSRYSVAPSPGCRLCGQVLRRRRRRRPRLWLHSLRARPRPQATPNGLQGFAESRTGANYIGTRTSSRYPRDSSRPAPTCPDRTTENNEYARKQRGTPATGRPIPGFRACRAGSQ